jgi:cytochrome P450
MTHVQAAPDTLEIPDLGDPATFARAVPHEVFDALRQRGPMYWQPATRGVKNGGFWFVVDRQTMIDIEADSETFTATLGMAQPMTGLEPGHPSKDVIFAMDAPRHARVRRAAVRSFAPRVVAKFEEWVTGIVKEALDDAVALGEFDYVQEIAVTIPARVVARIMGLPGEDREKLVAWTVAVFEGQARMDAAAIVKASSELYAYASELQRIRLAEPADDMISELAASVERGDLSQEEFLEYCRALMIAGFETTHTLIGHSMRLMVEDPEIARIVDETMASAGPAPLTSEFLRYICPVLHFARTATRDLEFAGEQVKKNDVMVLSYASANRDPELFAEPHRFWPGRPNGDQHRCIGQALAELEMRVLLQEISDRKLVFELNGPPERGNSTFINQLRSLPVRVVR